MLRVLLVTRVHVDQAGLFGQSTIFDVIDPAGCSVDQLREPARRWIIVRRDNSALAWQITSSQRHGRWVAAPDTPAWRSRIGWDTVPRARPTAWESRDAADACLERSRAHGVVVPADAVGDWSALLTV